MPTASFDSVNPFNIGYPAGEFFAGRENQLKQLHELLFSLSNGMPSNLYVVGKGGEGKTSYLDKVVDESRKLGLLACRCNIDDGKSAKINIDGIIRALLRELEKQIGERGLEDDWQSKEKSTFRTPKLEGLQSNDLALDFERLRTMFNNNGIKASVICIDEGQLIHPNALSALKNSLQSVKSGYMIVLSLLNDPNNKSSYVIGEVDNEKAGRDILNELANRAQDPGAHRFFQNGTILGPFDTQVEAEECIHKRLEKNIIQFNPPAVSLLIRITGRHPNEMVKLAHAAYELAKISFKDDLNNSPSQPIQVGEKIISAAFIRSNKDIIRYVNEFKDSCPSFTIDIWKQLSISDSGLTAAEITKKMCPNLNGDALFAFSEAVQKELDRLSQTQFCKKLSNGLYSLPGPNYAYALELTLGGI